MGGTAYRYVLVTGLAGIHVQIDARSLELRSEFVIGKRPNDVSYDFNWPKNKAALQAACDQIYLWASNATSDARDGVFEELDGTIDSDDYDTESEYDAAMSELVDTEKHNYVDYQNAEKVEAARKEIKAKVLALFNSYFK